MKKLLLFLVFCAFYSIISYGQNGILKTVFNKDSVITFRSFDTKINRVEASKSKELIMNLVNSGKNDELVLQNSLSDTLGLAHQFYIQFYKGIRVENAMYISHIKDGIVECVNGDFFKINNIDVNPIISKEQALKNALNKIGAKKYKWEMPSEEEFIKDYYNDRNATYYPTGELVILFSKASQSFRLAYKFNIFAYFPLDHSNVYIDAKDGEVLEKQNLIFDTNQTGTATTRYSGTQTITTDSYPAGFRLHELINSVRVETRNMQNNSDTVWDNAIDFSDNDNNWTYAEYHNSNFDDAALDAHWGAEKTYSYWNTLRGVNSWNGSGAPLLNYVHVDLSAVNPNYDNDNAL